MDTVASFHQFQTIGGFSGIIQRRGRHSFLFYISVYSYVYIFTYAEYLVFRLVCQKNISKVDHFKDILLSFNESNTNLLFIVTFIVGSKYKAKQASRYKGIGAFLQ
jgi:hypothetical protein